MDINLIEPIKLIWGYNHDWLGLKVYFNSAMYLTLII